MGQFVDNGLLLAGDVYISEILAGGALGPAVGPINVTKLEATPPTVDEKTRTSNKKANFGQALDSVSVPKDPAKLAISWDTATKSLLADAVGGKAEDYTKESQTLTDVAVTLTEVGFVRIGYQDIISTGFTVEKAEGNVALTEGTDYEVNLELGLIHALTSAAAVPVLINGTTAAVTGTRVAGASEITKPRQILVDGENLATGEKVKVTFHQITFAATGATDLMGGEFVAGELEGTLVTPAGKDSPWEIITLNVS